MVFCCSGCEYRFLYHQAHPLQLPAVDVPRLHGVNPGGVHAGVAQNVRQTHDVPLQTVVRPGEKVPQVVGKHLLLRHPRLPAEGFHVPPDVAAVQRPAGAGDEDGAGGDPLRLRVAQQRPLQLRICIQW